MTPSVSLILTLTVGHELMVTILVVTVLVVMALVVRVQVVTVLIHVVWNKWVQVLPVQCKMECTVSSLVVTSNLILNVLASIFNFCFYYIWTLVSLCRSAGHWTFHWMALTWSSSWVPIVRMCTSAGHNILYWTAWSWISSHVTIAQY